jgi:hypothetical protein
VLLGSEQHVFVILPFNVAAVMPSELEAFSPVVWEELEAYLRAQHKQLKTLAPKTARQLWFRSIRRVRAADARAGYDDAARAFVLELRKHAEFDALIAPSLFIREAHIANQSARWDGVERLLEIEARTPAARALVASGLEGTIPAASLHVAVFDELGDKLYESQGGLEPLVDVVVSVRSAPAVVDGVSIGSDPEFEQTTRTDLFADREHVRDGIQAAFASFLPPLPGATE